MNYYFAYGSNLNIEQMAFRCPKAKRIGKTHLENWELSFNGKDETGYLTIKPALGKIVPIGIWAVSEENEASLDTYEGYPDFYFKKEMELPALNLEGTLLGNIKGFVYIMNDSYKYMLPSKRYWDTCKKGYQDFGFDLKILEEAYQKTQEELES